MAATSGRLRTRIETSSGGIVFREGDAGTEVALILTLPDRRWQLPKGMIDAGESLEQAALREVREETGLVAEIVAPIEKIEYWFFFDRGDGKQRIHKFVHFYLMRYLSGSVEDYDYEVEEARWFPADEALATLAFVNERKALAAGLELLKDLVKR